MFSLWQFILSCREGENSQFYFYQNTSKAISKSPYHVHNYSQCLSPGIEGRAYHRSGKQTGLEYLFCSQGKHSEVKDKLGIFYKHTLITN